MLKNRHIRYHRGARSVHSRFIVTSIPPVNISHILLHFYIFKFKPMSLNLKPPPQGRNNIETSFGYSSNKSQYFTTSVQFPHLKKRRKKHFLLYYNCEVCWKQRLSTGNPLGTVSRTHGWCVKYSNQFPGRLYSVRLSDTFGGWR